MRVARSVVVLTGAGVSVPSLEVQPAAGLALVKLDGDVVDELELLVNIPES